MEVFMKTVTDKGEYILVEMNGVVLANIIKESVGWKVTYQNEFYEFFRTKDEAVRHVMSMKILNG